MSRLPKPDMASAALLSKAIAGTALAGGLLWTAYHSVFSVAPGERAIKFSRLQGVLPDVIAEVCASLL